MSTTMCILGCLLPCWVCVCWCSYQLFLGLCLPCDCDGVSVPFVDLAQACIICMHCVGVCTVLCAVASMIKLQYLCWPLVPAVWGLYSHWLSWGASGGGMSSDHVVNHGPLTLCCYTATSHWVHSRLQMQWGAMLCCLKPYLIHSLCHSCL